MKQYIRLFEAVEYETKNNMSCADDHTIENLVISPNSEALCVSRVYLISFLLQFFPY